MILQKINIRIQPIFITYKSIIIQIFSLQLKLLSILPKSRFSEVSHVVGIFNYSSKFIRRDVIHPSCQNKIFNYLNFVFVIIRCSQKKSAVYELTCSSDIGSEIKSLSWNMVAICTNSLSSESKYSISAILDALSYTEILWLNEYQTNFGYQKSYRAD